MDPIEILKNDKIKNSFSPTDIRALTYLGFTNINQPKYEIIAKNFTSKNEIIITFKDKSNSKIFKINLFDTEKKEEIINNISKKDAYEIGFIDSISSTNNEKKLNDKAD